MNLPELRKRWFPVHYNDIIDKTKSMRFCFISAVLLGWAGLVAAQAASTNEPVQAVQSVVKPDPRSGRLIRTIIVPGRKSSKRIGAKSAEPALIRFVDETARRYEVDPLLVHSVIQVESNYDPWAVSPKGAMGLMQLMPVTAQRFSVANAFSPAENVEGGVRYLKHLLNLFQDERLAVAAYNAGEGAVSRYGNVPPYPETSAYVQKVEKRVGEARKVRGETRKLEPEARPQIEEYVDFEGRIHIRMRQ